MSNNERPAPSSVSEDGPTPRQWMAVFSMAVAATVYCTTEFVPVGILRYISEGLGVSEGEAGIMVTAPGILAAIAAPLLTVAVGERDRRYVLWGLGALLVLSNLLAMVAPTFSVLIVGRMLFGIGLGGFWAIGASLGGRLVGEKSSGKATSIIFAGVSVGMLIGGPAGAFFGDIVGWRATFAVSLGLSLISLAAQVMFLPALHVKQRVKPKDLVGIAMTPKGKIGLIAMLLVLAGQFGTYTYITPFLANISGFSAPAISSILLGYTLIGLVGNFIGGAVSGRSEKRTLLGTIVFFVVPVLLLPVLGASSQFWTIVLLAVWGLAYGAMPIALQAWMNKAAPDLAEGGMALFVANFQVAIAVGSFVGGVVVDRFGMMEAMLSGATLGILAASLIAMSGLRPLGAQSRSMP